MKGVSKAVAKLFALAAVALILVAQPLSATPKLPTEGQTIGTLVRSIIRHIRDLTDISFPPG